EVPSSFKEQTNPNSETRKKPPQDPVTAGTLFVPSPRRSPCPRVVRPVLASFVPSPPPPQSTLPPPPQSTLPPPLLLLLCRVVRPRAVRPRAVRPRIVHFLLRHLNERCLRRFSSSSVASFVPALFASSSATSIDASSAASPPPLLRLSSPLRSSCIVLPPSSPTMRSASPSSATRFGVGSGVV
ncbi:uncharacterized protein LOC124845226, partial [Vigna umbellata]|uniref:uncharacterized protein LOC124845226 n=1 Tax=Vigna umbellata TaxID=87088 RepID=UPI001F5FA17A